MEFRSKFPPRGPLCLAELMVASSVGEHERLDLGLMGILEVLFDCGVLSMIRTQSTQKVLSD